MATDDGAEGAIPSVLQALDTSQESFGRTVKSSIVTLPSEHPER
jgi:hypothetical protein